MNTKTVAFIVVGLNLALAGPCYATVVIDQPVASSNFQIQFYSPFGQSFTAVSTSVESIGLKVTNLNAATNLEDQTLTLDLFSGEGFSGSRIATATANVASIIGDGASASGFIAFSMGSVAVNPGQAYSFRVTDTSARYGLGLTGTDVYAGGHAFFDPTYSGSWLPETSDLTFNVTAVPEASSLAYFALGGIALAATIRRRKGAAFISI